MAGESGEDRARLGKRFDRVWKLLGRVSMSQGIPLCEPEYLFIFKPDEVYPEGHLWPGFAPLHSMLEGRTYVVEHFSTSLRPRARQRMLTLCHNLAHEYDRWRDDGAVSGHPLAGSRPPVLVIAAPSRPDAFLRAGTLAPDPEIRGLYRGLGDYAELLYLWFYGLDPDERRWDLLRWAVPPHPRSRVDRMRYFEDPAVPVEQKREVWSAIMSEQYAIELGADENPYDVVLEKGVQQGLERGLEQGLERGLEQGLERGLEQGLERGLEALLLVARNVLAESELRRFQKKPISAELLDELREAITDRLGTDS